MHLVSLFNAYAWVMLVTYYMHATNSIHHTKLFPCFSSPILAMMSTTPGNSSSSTLNSSTLMHTSNTHDDDDKDEWNELLELTPEWNALLEELDDDDNANLMEEEILNEKNVLMNNEEITDEESIVVEKQSEVLESVVHNNSNISIRSESTMLRSVDYHQETIVSPIPIDQVATTKTSSNSARSLTHLPELSRRYLTMLGSYFTSDRGKEIARKFTATIVFSICTMAAAYSLSIIVLVGLVPFFKDRLLQ